MAKMRRGEVKELALERLRHVSTLRAFSFAREIDVPYITVHRAFGELIAERLARKFHGGISAFSPPERTLTVSASKTSLVESSTIKALAQLVRKDQAIILDWSTVTLQLSQHVPADLNVTVITNSPAIAASFSEHQQVKVRMIGGWLHNGGFVPSEKEETKFLEFIHVDLCVLGLCNLDREGRRISTSNPEQAKLRSAMIANASRVAVMVSNDTLDNSAIYTVGLLEKLTHIIPDSTVSDERLQPYKELGINIVRE